MGNTQISLLYPSILRGIPAFVVPILLSSCALKLPRLFLFIPITLVLASLLTSSPLCHSYPFISLCCLVCACLSLHMHDSPLVLHLCSVSHYALSFHMLFAPLLCTLCAHVYQAKFATLCVVCLCSYSCVLALSSCSLQVMSTHRISITCCAVQPRGPLFTRHDSDARW